MPGGSLPQAAAGFADANEQILRVEGLTVSFDGFKAVDGLSLSVERNELRVIIGPNGAGKTTLLDMICGKTRPSAGRVLFNGQDLGRLNEYEIVRAGVGRKFQTPSVYEDLTVLENFELSLPRMHGLLQSLRFRRTPALRARIDAMAGQVFLSERIGDRAGQLSHGQKQWLEIGMLLMQEPELLLLDEPVAGMSAREREQTGDLLRRISAGKSVVVIEHDMDFVKRIAHRVTVLHQGRLLSEGTAAEVQADPRVIAVYLGH
ncbi:urea ABC transporter ATP-binding protein UrtD [Verminephrobacter eiseniae]|uniref:urea ABC transporter ATP-binding protein UrtD n=1 Tax=Verminephrobacter eiseniae TaxID=364317 RepID=UPI002237E3B7|nr:urea ABC transporter ATP-binding protein UrtD [Verminephrobacter eiseniae]MCW5232740.1 urea ABC transporter ATP-binding protein UrtD [Verminephrobacter eiseniae]MCW5295696.1 urea ABC transporter ATP-binding protein UrtD [Verminephrobacter eiseniae]MCW8186767.1 urea ABC transporter ATP-binding protein UrtD [Verminephrobacter eiseniae]MCW8221813.1 urea ABC transporter ATP-binding protein UrtD [Verminephrobacter eiseniae]MCW8232497.1 urea ABC transporter ATP-binding protein UrtD [Verminephroba